MKSKKWARRRSGCKYCYDDIYPYYGMAPHIHDLSNGTFIGSTRLLPMSAYPKNFEPDPEQVEEWKNGGLPPAQGVWYCPKCGKKK